MEDKLNFKEALETGTAKFWKSLFYLLDHEEAASKIPDDVHIIADRFVVNGVTYKVWLTNGRAGITWKVGEEWKSTWTHRHGRPSNFPYARLLERLIEDISTHY